jgi:hypothetical protein
MMQLLDCSASGTLRIPTLKEGLHGSFTTDSSGIHGKTPVSGFEESGSLPDSVAVNVKHSSFARQSFPTALQVAIPHPDLWLAAIHRIPLHKQVCDVSPYAFLQNSS